MGHDEVNEAQVCVVNGKTGQTTSSSTDHFSSDSQEYILEVGNHAILGPDITICLTAGFHLYSVRHLFFYSQYFSSARRKRQQTEDSR